MKNLQQQRRRSGFTLVELLVVISIIGLLSALALPAIMQARITMIMGQTVHDAEQIAKGIQNYQSTKHHYPPLFIDDPATGYDLPWGKLLLPYIDQKILEEQLRGNVDFSTHPAATLFVDLYLAPSDDASEDEPSNSWGVNAGLPDKTNSTPSTPIFADLKANGIFHDWRFSVGADPTNTATHLGKKQVKVSVADVKDGTDTTLLFVENHNLRTWTDTSAEYAQGVVWTVNLTSPQPFSEDFDTLNYNFARPASHLPGVIVAANCGGSVRKIAVDIDYHVYCQLMTPNGSEAADALGTTPPSGMSAADFNTFKTYQRTNIRAIDLEE